MFGILDRALTRVTQFILRTSPTAEDFAIVSLLRDKRTDLFLEFFLNNEVPFKGTSPFSRLQSPTNRVVVIRYVVGTSVIVDGLDLDYLELPLPFSERHRVLRELQEAVLSNVFGTVPYEKRHFGDQSHEASVTPTPKSTLDVLGRQRCMMDHSLRESARRVRENLGPVHEDDPYVLRLLEFTEACLKVEDSREPTSA